MTATVAHRCALCNTVLCHGDLTPNGADAASAAHHAVCPARPVEVGDYVRWDNKQAGRWCEGSVVDVVGDTFWIKVDRCTVGWTPIAARADGACPFGAKRAKIIRRIPRPAEAQATCEHPLPWQGSPEGWRCLACGQPTGRTLDTRHVAQPPPAPVLVDPLDVEYDGARLRDLLVHDERQRQEDHAWDEFAYGQLTPAQRAAVSAHWSAALRAKVTASAEDERNRVRVDRQDEP